VQYYIASTSTVNNNDIFLLGGIIAIPGPAAPPTDCWAPADGQTLSKADYPSLYDVLQDAWGPDNGKTFTLPDLNGKFLRATDEIDAAISDPWGDPDRGSRTGSGTGSTQKNASGMPKNPFNIPISNARDDQDNAATGIGRETAEYCEDDTTFKAKGGDSETAPAHLRVNFYVKIKSLG
jgi:microcystin-dependent protein